MRFARGNGRALVVLAAVAWAVSLALPALDAGGRTFSGLEVLLRGWQGLPRGVYAWLANPLFAAALVAAYVKRDLAALLLAGGALALGATSFSTEAVLRESMASVPPIDLAAGFYVWLAALLALCLHSLTSLASRVVERRGRRSIRSGTSRD